MVGLGSIINGAGIAAGGLIGHFAGKLFQEKQQDALTKACGISVLFIAIAGAMEKILQIDNGALNSGKSMLIVLCLTLGAAIGEFIDIENGFEKFGEWLKMKTGNNNLCDGVSDGLYRRHDDCRRDSGRHIGRLFYFGRQIRTGFDYYRRDDFIYGERLRLFRDSRFACRGRYYAFSPFYRADYNAFGD